MQGDIYPLTLFLPTFFMDHNPRRGWMPYPPPFINPYQNNYKINHIYVSLPLNLELPINRPVSKVAEHSFVVWLLLIRRVVRRLIYAQIKVIKSTISRILVQ